MALKDRARRKMPARHNGFVTKRLDLMHSERLAAQMLLPAQLHCWLCHTLQVNTLRRRLLWHNHRHRN
jgi:hypothetical protein